MRKIYIFLILVTLVSCRETEKRFTKLEDAQNYVIHSFTESEEKLFISNELNDEMGINMAILADGILKKGYLTVGFEQKNGYRIYKYIKN